MSLLEKIGLSPKRKEITPLMGEKLKKEQEAYSLKRNPYLRAFIFICFIGISILSFPHATINSGLNYTVGQPWRADDLVAPYTFAIKKTEAEIETEQEQINQTISPIFRVEPSASIDTQTKIDSLYKRIMPVLEGYYVWQESKENNLNSVFEDSIRFAQSYSNTSISAY